MVYTRFNTCKVKGLKCAPSTYNPVQKQFKSVCDVNNIVRRAFAGDPTVFRAARYGDSTSAPSSLHEALQDQIDARNSYEALPDEVKAAYPTPESFFAACHDEKQGEMLRKLGVVETHEEASPVKVEVINNPSPEGAA